MGSPSYEVVSGWEDDSPLPPEAVRSYIFILAQSDGGASTLDARRQMLTDPLGAITRTAAQRVVRPDGNP
jgi:hypothetical protein